MYLEIRKGGWGLHPDDEGKTVKVTSLEPYGGEPGALIQGVEGMVSVGSLVCHLRSFLYPAASQKEVDSLFEEIKHNLASEKKLLERVFEWEKEECRSPYCECEVGKCSTGHIDKRGEPLKSDGGSSLYYDLPIPQKLLDKLIERSEQGSCFIKTEEIITHLLANSFDYGNLFKSLIRCKGLQDGTGGKAGNSVDYECNKMKYSVEKIREMKCA